MNENTKKTKGKHEASLTYVFILTVSMCLINFQECFYNVFG